VQAVIAWLSGKKTIISTLALGIIGILASAGTIHLSDQWVQILTLLVATFTGVSARLAVTKLQAQLKAKK